MKHRFTSPSSATSSRTRQSSLPAIFIVTISFIILTLASQAEFAHASDNLVKITSTIMIENDGISPLTHYLIERDERNKSRLSHIVAKLDNLAMPVTTADDGKLWRIDLTTRPIEPGAVMPLTVTKVYTHLELVPSNDIYLMPYSTIQYQARIIKQGRPQKIKLPSEQYYLVVDNKELVELDESTSTAMALETEGTTRISFVDMKVIEDEDFIQPGSNIHIVNPSYLTMHISPGDSWALQKFTDYTVEVRIFDEHHHQIHPSDNLDIKLVASNEIVVTTSTQNGTYHTIHSLTNGSGKLTATLLGATPINYSFGRPMQHIEVVRELSIHDPLDIKPTAIVLPWVPELQPNYQFSIYAAGGTGSYKWSTNNTDLLDISYSDDDTSVAKITTLGEGTAFIICLASKSPVFSKHSMVAVTRVDEISILPSITETEVGGDILLPVAIYSNVTSMLALHLPNEEIESGLVLFHDCSKVKFKVEIVEKTRFSYDPTEVMPNNRPKACISLRFTCTQPGTSRVWISYSDTIKTTTVIACYKPLKAIYPSDVGVLALGTSVEVAFDGGPRPFANRHDDHYAHLEADANGVLSFEPIIDRYRFNKDLHVFRATCREYGDARVTLSVGNQPSAILTNPASSKSSIQLICAKPDSIQVRPRLRATCPLNDMLSLTDIVVPVSSFAPTEFELILFDDSKRQFLNISSFEALWTHSGPVKSSSKQQEEVNAVSGFRKTTRNYITIHPTGQEGLGKLEASVSDLKSELELQFVDSAKISSNKTIVVNHVKNVVGLSIQKGSGHFSVESLQGAKHANVSYVSVYGQHKISITPLAVGDFIVRLDDQCIESKSVLSEINVMNADHFKKEIFKPGNTMHFCDEMTFCVYLNVQRVTKFDSNHDKQATQSPPKPTVKASSSTPAPPVTATLHKQEATSLAPAVAVPAHQKKPAVIEPLNERFSTTPIPVTAKITFDYPPQQKNGKDGVSGESTILRQLIGYALMIIVALAVIALSYKWWQEQQKRKPPAQFITMTPNTSFASHQSPGRMNRSSPFMQNTSSTPHVRPLYSEKFSTTLLSD